MNTPLYDYLKDYAASGIIPFHMPGHKLGKGLPHDFGRNLASFDITEIPGSDNLHNPTGIIKKAQDLAAEAFGSNRTFFLVNGSTCGIYAMISTICKPGDSLIVARDCHASVISGMMLAGVKPIFIMPEYNSILGITTSIRVDEIRQVLANNPSAAGVLLTRPNYYGICCNIEEIAAAVHSYGKILAVDEAHGAHLRFGTKLPKCAMDAGVDICVQSAHKTLPALTQGAYLHVKSEGIDLERLQYYLTIYQTSSPSYIIMASLDMAREIMQMEGRVKLDTLISLIEEKKTDFYDESISFVDNSIIKDYCTDPTRLVINTAGLGISGFEAEIRLRQINNIQVEMSDLYNLVCIATVCDTEDSINSLFLSVKQLCRQFAGRNPLQVFSRDFMPELPQRCEYSGIMELGSELVVLSKAANRMSKGIIAPYPPGIPVVCPGETISQTAVDYIFNVIAAGGKVSGLNENLEINVIK